MYRVLGTISERELEEDISEYAQQILDGYREIEDDDGNPVDPTSLDPAALREAASNELGDEWCELWLTRDKDGWSLNADRDVAATFATIAEAEAAIAAYGETDTTWEII